MEFEQYFEQDKVYQEILSLYKRDKKTVKDAVEAGSDDYASIRKAIDTVGNKLQESIRDFNEERKQELLDEQQEIIDSYQPDIDYQSNEAEQFRVKFKLADDYELKNYVQDIAGDNPLELNLLRMELKDRNMNDQDMVLKNVSFQQTSQYTNDERFNEINQRLATFNTMGNDKAVIDGDLKSIEAIKEELTTELKEAAERGQKQRKGTMKEVLDANKKTMDVQNIL